MKQLFDYLPVIVFFGLYFLGGRDIMLATWGILIATTAQVTLGWLIWRKVQKMHLIVFVITLIFGSMTLFFQNDVFIKWRPSIISFTLGGVLLLGHFVRERNLLQRLCESLMVSGFGFVVALSRRDWTLLNIAFVLYFAFIGALNLYIAFNFSTDFWVNFKLFGFTALQMIFYISVFAYVFKKMSEEDRKRIMKQDSANESTDSSTENAPSDNEKKDDHAVRDHQ
ncbi:inner membrane-spanning protein YciB [Alcanivorax sp.]|uniref:inner membrane-spanning protein YciB n=1 Tax=Alcanivorax sp. TaxID=1872427 RepID=UPI0032D8DD9F